MAQIGGFFLRKQDAREGEEVRWSSRANRFQGSRAIGGKLFLTDARLLFNPHLVDGLTGGKTWQVGLEEIRDVGKEPKGSGKASKMGGGLRDRLRISVRDGSEELFVVSKLDEVVERLSSAAETPAGG